MGGAMQYVGTGQGEYTVESTYKYVGHGGDFTNVPRRRDFTCLICTALSLLLGLLCIICWIIWSPGNECLVDADFWQVKWSPAKQVRCCARQGIGCPEELLPKMQLPLGAVDPYNCAVALGAWQAEWSTPKKEWCCKVHKKGCGHPGPAKAFSYDCSAGFANFAKGWSQPKMSWCCAHGGKGCAAVGATMQQAQEMGYGAGAQHEHRGAPRAPVNFNGFR